MPVSTKPRVQVCWATRAARRLVDAVCMGPMLFQQAVELIPAGDRGGASSDGQEGEHGRTEQTEGRHASPQRPLWIYCHGRCPGVRRRIATSSASGPPLASSAHAHEPGRKVGAGNSLPVRTGDQGTEPADAEPFVPVSEPPLDQPVGVHEQRPVLPVEPHRRRRPVGVLENPENRAVRRGHGPGGPVGEHQRRRMPRQPYGRLPPSQVERDRREGREDVHVPPLADEHLLQRGEDGVVGNAGQDQRPPGHAEFDSERGLVDTVSAHVADHRDDTVGRRLDHVVEVPAEQGAVPAGLVEGVHPDRVGLEDRLRQESTLEPAILLLQDLGLAQPSGVLVGALALDGVTHRPRE